MNLSDRKTLFPERESFAAWRKRLDVRTVIEECTEWTGAELSAKANKKKRLEALYEFLAAQGRLAEFDSAWRAIEDEHK